MKLFRGAFPSSTKKICICEIFHLPLIDLNFENLSPHRNFLLQFQSEELQWFRFDKRTLLYTGIQSIVGKHLKSSSTNKSHSLNLTLTNKEIWVRMDLTVDKIFRRRKGSSQCEYTFHGIFGLKFLISLDPYRIFLKSSFQLKILLNSK